jgi:hypothetical protein
MIAQVIIQNPVDNVQYDISDLVISLEWNTTLAEQPGKLTFTYIDDKKTFFTEGTRVAATIGDVGLFSGFIFKRERTESHTVSVTAYDQLRYLQNKDVINMPILTSSQVFERICKEQELIYKVIHPSTYKCTARVHDNKSYYEMIQSALDDTLLNAGELFFIRDNFGTLEHLSVEKWFDEKLTSIIVGDASLVTSYKFESSIDDDTFNAVKLVRDNKDTAKRDVYIVSDPNNIGRWGRLQFFERMNEESNPAQIKARADMILRLKNRPTRSLSLECLGDYQIRAGNGVMLNISDLKNENLNQNARSAIVYTCTHKFEGDSHTMSLELEVI